MTPKDDLNAPIEDSTQFQPDDSIIYSGVIVYFSGRVKSIIYLKEIQDADIGADFCEFVGGQWLQNWIETRSRC